jgi:hypothetical protein
MWLNRIQLNLDITRYFELFGVDINPVVHIRATANMGALLRNIPGLKHLELFFRNPYESRNPWYNFHDRFRRTLWFMLDEDYYGTERYPCQKTVVDWVLTFAFPYIKNIPNIHLLGSVKKSTKDKWYNILEREYRERKCDFRTHGYDHRLELRAILDTPVYE